MASHRLVSAGSPVASSSSATRECCDRRSFHSQRAPNRHPKMTGRGRTHPGNCFPERKCCTRTATATAERPSPIVCPWQAMSPSDGQPVASDPAFSRDDRVSAGRTLEILRGPRGVNPTGAGDEQTFRTPNVWSSRQARPSEGDTWTCPKTGADVSHSRRRRHLPEVPCLSAESDASIVTRWIASPAPSALRVSHPLSGLLPMHPRSCISSRIHS
jgi:hypothetical protein